MLRWLKEKLKRNQVPKNWKQCVVCKRYFPLEDLHAILGPSGDVMYYVCDSCISLPPSKWRWAQLEEIRRELKKKKKRK